MSSYALLFIVVIIPSVISEGVQFEHNCVVEVFENGLQGFDNTIGPCLHIPGLWDVVQYTDVDVTPPHVLSTAFIRSSIFACTSSYDFQMSATGTLEVTFFMASFFPGDFFQVSVNQRLQSGATVQVNVELYNLLSPGVNNEVWSTVRFEVGSVGDFTGFVSNIVYKFLYSLINPLFFF